MATTNQVGLTKNDYRVSVARDAAEAVKTEEARLAWLNLVCANRYNYPEDLEKKPEAPEPEQEVSDSDVEV